MELKPGYKQTEVGVIPEDWKLSTIGAYTNWMSGGTPSRSNDEFWHGSIPWISGSTLKSFAISTSDQFLSESGVMAGSKMAPSGAVLLLVRGSALHNEIRAGMVVSPVAFNQDVKALIPLSGLDSRYLTFFILAMESDLLKLVSLAGNSAGVLDTELIKNFKLLLPTKAEQTAIANALSDADALIQSLIRLIAKKRQIKQGAMQILLNPYENGRLKAGWEVKKLGDVADIRSGGTPSTRIAEFWNGEILWCTPTDITALRGKKYLYSTSRKITSKGLAVSSAEIIPENSIVMTSRATIGECAINKLPVSTNQGFKNFVPYKDVDIEFLYYQLLTQKREFIGLCSGSTFLEISKNQLFNFEIQLPRDVSEQTRIATILSDMDAEITALEAKLAKYRHIKQGMMQNLLTGRIRLI
ncbi:MAG TPA: restriction endonuclease subunit S [Nitrosomonas sp.]|nr:restriction endonuclease subunit S [Nitrosomonas sp.]